MNYECYNKFLQAKQLIKSKRNEEALEIFKELYEVDKEDLIIKFYYAKALLKQTNKTDEKNKIQAKQLLEELVEQHNDTYAMLELAKIEIKDENYSIGRKWLEKIIEIGNRKDKNYALLELGKLDSIENNITAAKEKFNEVIKNGNDKDKSFALLELGRLYAINGDYEKARNIFKNLINHRNKKTSFHALFELGRLENRRHNYEQARIYLESLIEIGSSSDKAYAILELGRLERDLGNFKEAKKEFNSLLFFNDKFNQNLAKLELGILEVMTGNKDDAKNYFNSLLNTEHREKALYELGYIEVRCQNYEVAENYFKEIVNSKNKKTSANAILGIIFLNMKVENYNKAYYWLNKILNDEKLRGKANYETLTKSKFYIEYNLGLIEDYDSIEEYFSKQVIDYNSERTLEYVGSNVKFDESNKLNDIETIFEESKIIIKDICPNSFSVYDKYRINFDHVVGTIYGKETATAVAVTLLNTKDIIDIYPAVPQMSTIDCNYTNNKEKIKTIN